MVFHLAAIISVTGDPTGIVWRVDVEGPRNVAIAALEQGVTRFVHGSVHAFDLEACGPSLDESKPRPASQRVPVNDRSKYAGEQRVRSVVVEGLDAVIVNPTGVIGPYDYGPSRMGEAIEQLGHRKIPINVGEGFDVVDVHDVVAGTIGAMRRGRTGENYLLSGTRVSMKELGLLVSELATVRPPRMDVPLRLAALLAPPVLRLTPGPEDRVVDAGNVARAALLPGGQPLQGLERAGLRQPPDPRNRA